MPQIRQRVYLSAIENRQTRTLSSGLPSLPHVVLGRSIGTTRVWFAGHVKERVVVVLVVLIVLQRQESSPPGWHPGQDGVGLGVAAERGQLLEVHTRPGARVLVDHQCLFTWHGGHEALFTVRLLEQDENLTSKERENVNIALTVVYTLV